MPCDSHYYFAEKSVRRFLKNKAGSYFAPQNDKTTQLIKNPQPVTQKLVTLNFQSSTPLLPYHAQMHNCFGSF
jgi:hypothetical protein